MIKIEIDEGSGFCFGVTTAIRKAEEELAGGGTLYCLGDIVHNGSECDRLKRLGLITIDHTAFSSLSEGKVLLRAHGEPPSTYASAAARGIRLVDATCPVVLRLQRLIGRTYAEPSGPQVVIYGKPGHAEVLGLVGQTEGTAIVVQSPEEAERLDFTRDICLFSQTTQPREGFRQISEFIEAHIQPPATFRAFDTICRSVRGRVPGIRSFASRHDVIIFVCGLKSSNGRVLYEACRDVNPRTYMIDCPEALRREWFEGCDTVGICGATSTPAWLMADCRDAILDLTR